MVESYRNGQNKGSLPFPPGGPFADIFLYFAFLLSENAIKLSGRRLVIPRDRVELRIKGVDRASLLHEKKGIEGVSRGANLA
jgi:hypothetical protein